MQHKLIEQLQQPIVVTSQFDAAMVKFVEAKPLSMENFKKGVLYYLEFANMLPADRVSYFNTEYAGLYNNNHIAYLWNNDKADEEKIEPHDLDSIAPRIWEVVYANDVISLKYSGAKPADALIELLKGPSVIDCGMFTQLGIWFGILHLVGIDQFNVLFGHKTLLITRFNFEPATAESEALGNPLFEFFTPEQIDSVAIEHLFNDALYSIKHPGGNEKGDNCLVIDNHYYNFTPLKFRSDLTRSAVILDLVAAFNAVPDENDRYTKERFSENRGLFESMYGSIYNFEFSALIWYRVLSVNPHILRAYSWFLEQIPRCKALRDELFNDANGFIASFTEDPSWHQEKYQSFFNDQLVKETFYHLLMMNPATEQFYFQRILGFFSEWHDSLAEETLTLELFIARQSMVTPSKPAFIYFDLNKFLHSLGLLSLKSEERDSKRLKSEADLNVTDFPGILFQVGIKGANPVPSAYSTTLSMNSQEEN